MTCNQATINLVNENKELRERNLNLSARNDQLEKVIHELQDKIREMLSDIKKK